jgi:branched-chain amino acid transport system permease protein
MTITERRLKPRIADLVDSVVQVAAGVSPPLLLIGLVVGAVALFANAVVHQEAIVMLVNVVLVVGLYTFVGNSGVVSFGQMSFMAVGGYIAGIVTEPVALKHFSLPQLPGFLASAHLSFVQATLLGGLAASVAGVVLAIPLMRMAGLAAGIATLAVLQITEVVANGWGFVGASSGLIGVPRNTTLWNAFIWAGLAIVAAFLMQRSRPGLRLRAAREDERAASAIGVRVFRDRTVAFAISALIVGVGGALYVQYYGLFNPSSFYLSTTAITLAMLIIGGMGSLTGAVVGTVVISVLTDLLGRVETTTGVNSLSEVGLALVMLTILIIRPSGLISRDVYLRLPRRRKLAIDYAPLPATTEPSEADTSRHDDIAI